MKKTINLVGNFKSDVDTFFDKIDLNLKEISYKVVEKHFETVVEITGSDALEDVFVDTVRKFADVFKSFVYGIDEQNVYTCAYKLLKENGVKIAIAEGVSGGRLSSEFVSYSPEDVKDILLEADVNLSKESQIKRFGIEPSFFEKYELESVEAVYELARGLLYVSGADLAIATSGKFGASEEDVSQCFIAIGDNQVINVFKHSFKGTKNKVMQQISKYSFLHLIKKLQGGSIEHLIR